MRLTGIFCACACASKFLMPSGGSCRELLLNACACLQWCLYAGKHVIVFFHHAFCRLSIFSMCSTLMRMITFYCVHFFNALRTLSEGASRQAPAESCYLMPVRACNGISMWASIELLFSHHMLCRVSVFRVCSAHA